jgi:hypothetical protein
MTLWRARTKIRIFAVVAVESCFRAREAGAARRILATGAGRRLGRRRFLFDSFEVGGFGAGADLWGSFGKTPLATAWR